MIRNDSETRLGFVLLVVLALAILLPRGLALNKFVTADEPKWLARSGNFYLALSTGDLAGTFTREHPGVTVTWLGAIGLMLRYPGYVQDAPGRLEDASEIEPVLREHGVQPIAVLQAGRFLVVLVITITLLLSFVEARRVIGLWPAFIGFMLLALDPFFAGLTRLLHLDGLVSSLMLLSILSYMVYLFRGRKTADLLISGIAAGLAWLTKSPAFFLAPFLGLLALFDLVRTWTGKGWISWEDLWQESRPLLVWAGLGWLVFVILWPSMWVNPVTTLSRIFAEATTYAEEGHSTDIFFNGSIIAGDPGKRFYPVVYLWRTSPVILAGLGLAGIWFILALRYKGEEVLRWVAVSLVAFAALFSIFMTLGSKKFDRYLLPVFPPLDLVSGIGWYAAGAWLGRLGRPGWSKFALPALAILAIGWQALGTVRTYPYYLSYYDPLMGGSRKAPGVMMIGWGEGLDQAARYLDDKPDAESLRVMAWYPDGAFSYLFDGETLGAEPEWEETQPIFMESDYVVTYAHQWQRNLPFPEMLAYLRTLEPEYVVILNGIEYAQVYKMH